MWNVDVVSGHRRSVRRRRPDRMNARTFLSRMRPAGDILKSSAALFPGWTRFVFRTVRHKPVLIDTLRLEAMLKFRPHNLTRGDPNSNDGRQDSSFEVPPPVSIGTPCRSIRIDSDVPFGLMQVGEALAKSRYSRLMIRQGWLGQGFRSQAELLHRRRFAACTRRLA